VYAVPFVNPETVIGLDAPVPVIEPGDDVAVNPVIAEPPVAFSVKVTETFPLVTKSVAVPIVGACGTVVAVIEELAEDTRPVAVEFEALTVNV
jgi:hypothetical protein